MKKFKAKTIGIAALAACVAITPVLTACGNDDDLLYKGVTYSTIYVGNTAASTGASAGIGVPFNYGIKAAFWEYNENGGFSGEYNGKEVENLKVALKTYDDNSDVTKAVTYMQQLIEDDEVFAIVGNFGSYAVSANLDIIKEARVPMVYAAAGNEELAKDTATGADRYIFPVQPISSTEGAFLIQRAFAAKANGGLEGTKVGVITNNNDASQAMLNKIKAEANNLTSTQKGNINYQNVSDTNTGYGTAATALKNAGCDVIILAIATDYVKTISALMDAGFTSENVKLLTSYNNSATSFFDTTVEIGGVNYSVFDTTYLSIIDAVYAQGWIDITDDITGYWYNTEGGLFTEYKDLMAGLAIQYPDKYTGHEYDYGVPLFCEEYWQVAEVLYGFGVATPSAVPSDAALTPYTLSYNAYALAGYIAGNLFCQGLDTLSENELTLTRSNYVDAMESKVFDIALADTISYQNGKRLGVEAFSLNQFAGSTVGGATSSKVVHTLSTLDEIKGNTPSEV